MSRLFSLETFLQIVVIIVYGIYSYIRLVVRAIIPRPSKSLDGQIFLITGAATGIGREVVLHLAKNHPKTTLVLWDVNEIENREAAEGAKLLGVKAFSYKVDVSDRLQVEETAKRVERDVGHVTILFNNAGVSVAREFLKMSPEQMEKTVQVNLLSHFWTLRAFLPIMIENNHGHVVTTCSLAGLHGARFDVPYCASKFGVRGYLESLKSELRVHPLKPDKIQFTTVYPSYIRTQLATQFKLHSKFPFVIQMLEPKYAAEMIIEGIRQNQGNLFIPKSFEISLFFKNFMPKKLADLVEDFVIEKVEYVENERN